MNRVSYFLVVVKEENKKKIIEGVIKPSERVSNLIKTEHDAYACPVCRLNLDIKHTVSYSLSITNISSETEIHFYRN